MTDLAQLELDLINAIGAADTVAAVEAVRVSALGKTGVVSGLLKGMGAMSPDERREQGPMINGLRDRVSSALVAKKAELETAELDARLNAERLDLTLPARPRRKGGVHPTMQVMDEMIALFADMGFAVAEGPDIEDDFHNFTALNIPESHPARQMHDTFYLKGTLGEQKETKPPQHAVLRTHTSPVQIRTMVSQKPPIRIIAPGTTYRSDSDMTHTPMFHQIEGLVIEKACCTMPSQLFSGSKSCLCASVPASSRSPNLRQKSILAANVEKMHLSSAKATIGWKWRAAAWCTPMYCAIVG